jgi:tRNA-2-methylthio-N6-dimethylallyladenosine synthase
MRGCDNYCAYCVVPSVRGRERSIPRETILEQARRLAGKGAREITLLGQNVNSYADSTTDFAGIISRIHTIDGVERIRFTTSHPKDLGEKLIQTIAGLPKVCKHLHLPVQSGSSKILQAMNRGYTRDQYLKKIDAIRHAVPAIDLTTDVMVGFPGETDRDYADTVSLFKRVGFTAAFMFAYSNRPGTQAASMPDQVPEHVKKERLKSMIALQTGITKELYASMVHKEVQVLFTHTQGNKENTWIGQDYGCKRVLLHTDKECSGKLLTLLVARSTGMTLIAKG